MASAKAGDTKESFSLHPFLFKLRTDYKGTLCTLSRLAVEKAVKVFSVLLINTGCHYGSHPE